MGHGSTTSFKTFIGVHFNHVSPTNPITLCILDTITVTVTFYLSVCVCV